MTQQMTENQMHPTMITTIQKDAFCANMTAKRVDSAANRKKMHK